MPLRWIITVPFFLFSLLYMLSAPHSEHSILSCSCHSVHDVLVILQTVLSVKWMDEMEAGSLSVICKEWGLHQRKQRYKIGHTTHYAHFACRIVIEHNSAVAVPVTVRVRTRRPSLQYRRSRSIPLSLSAGDSRANPGKAKGNIITALLITLVFLSPLQAFLPHVWQGGRKLHNLKLHSTHDAGA